MTVIEGFAPAKINLTLHVTGRRADGYHELDSLVIFADIGDRIKVKPSDTTILTVDGPMAAGVPVDDSNLVLKAARMMRVNADIALEKHLPNAAGLGGGSGDAAATLRVLSGFSGRPIPGQGIELGADVPLCLQSEAARVTGIGETVRPLPGLPALHAVLVNPGVPVLTAQVFKRLEHKVNRPMPAQIPSFDTPGALVLWLRDMRNDLQEPAIEAEPAIGQLHQVLERTPGCQPARTSGSGGTCFGIYNDAETAGSAAGRLSESHPHWWVQPCVLNPA